MDGEACRQSVMLRLIDDNSISRRRGIACNGNDRLFLLLTSFSFPADISASMTDVMIMIPNLSQDAEAVFGCLLSQKEREQFLQIVQTQTHKLRMRLLFSSRQAEITDGQKSQSQNYSF